MRATRSGTWVLGAAVAGVLVLAGCSAPGAGGVGGAGDSGGTGPVTSALDFTASTVSGATFEAADSAGQPVVLWFWAPWCTICRAEAPDVAEVAGDLHGRVEFVGVAGRGPLEDMRDFVDQTRTGGFEHLADLDGSLWRKFGVVAQPTFVFVAPSGTTTSFAGSLGADELRARALTLVAG